MSKIIGLVGLLAGVVVCGQDLDLLIRNGSVLDGSGAAAVSVDIGISGDRIVLIGSSTGRKAKREIDARGLVVAPGFIDPHTHTLEDLSDPARSRNDNYLLQGVTSVVTGNDGQGPINIGATLRKLEQQGIGTNAALLVGQGVVRREVMGMSDSAPTPEQLERMTGLVNRAMQEGAIGMSTGLYYAPGNFAKTEEVIALAKAAAAQGGIYDSHMRDESSYSIGLIGSIQETIRIGREAGIPVHLSHIKALGKDVWGQSTEVIRIIRAARAEGVKVTADQYPYVASGSGVAASLLPRWAEAGGSAATLKRIDDPVVRPRLVTEMTANLERRGGPESLLITSASNRTLIGKTLGKIALERNESPVEAALWIIKSGGAGVASFNMREDDVRNFMKEDWVMTGSDGSTGHPRKYGTFPRKLRKYVFEDMVITLPFAIRSSTSLTAETLGLKERGLLKTGYFADVVIFDPATIADRATYVNPEVQSVGVRYVVVNGKLAVEDGRVQPVLAGRALAGYQAEIAEWRKDYDRDLRSEKGPLYLIARRDVPEGRTEIGSGVSHGIELPSHAPKLAGVIERHGDQVTFEPAAGIAAKLNGKPSSERSTLRTGMTPDLRDRIEFGDFEIAVSATGGDYQMAIRDRQSAYLKAFQGPLWFPVNAGYRLEGVFTAYPQPKELTIPDTSGRSRHMQAPGYVTFHLNGETLRLEPVVTGDELFFMFKDRTSAHETYGSGRFLEAEMPRDGKVILDFNKAYNPYCAFNPYSSCPIPQKGNRLMIRVEAGERYRGH